MKKFWLGFVSGVAATIVAAAAVIYVANARTSVLTVASREVSHALPDARVLDVSAAFPSEAKVNYVHNELYDVSVTYERYNEVRQIVLVFGKTGRTWVTPTTADIILADDRAKVLRKLSR
jgi:hypothetical protein